MSAPFHFDIVIVIIKISITAALSKSALRINPSCEVWIPAECRLLKLSGAPL